MNLLDLIRNYQEKLKGNPNDYSCLLFALQIPSICSRIEISRTPENTGREQESKLFRPNGNVWDANIYKHWLKMHKNSFIDLYANAMSIDVFCDNVYNLRCQLTHEGVLMNANNKFYFTTGKNILCVGDVVFLPVSCFCKDMFDAAYEMLFKHNTNINLSLFENVFVPSDVYKEISDDVASIYSIFWSNYSAEDHLLNCIYSSLFLGDSNIKDTIENFFIENPDSFYELYDDPVSNIDLGAIIDLYENFISFDSAKNVYVLRLTKAQYERMLQVEKEYKAFEEQHPFDIGKYLK